MLRSDRITSPSSWREQGESNGSGGADGRRLRHFNIVSESPVEVKLLDGWLNAKRLEILDSGDLIVFGGGVEMTLNVETPPSPAATPAASGSRQALAP